MSSKKSKKSEVKAEVVTHCKVRDYSQIKIDSDIKKTESAISKLQDSIKNHEKEFEKKK
jgi:hypothetical protein